MTKVTPTERRIRERVAKRRRVQASVAVVVTVLGDGVGQPGFDKRRSVQQHLRDIPRVIEVTLPEDMYERHPGVHVDDIEYATIDAADVVICIEAPHAPPLGLYTEFIRYFDPGKAHRWYRIYPSQRPDPREHPALVEGLAADDIASILDFDYELEWWEDCEIIRAACAKRVQKEISRQRAIAMRKDIG